MHETESPSWSTRSTEMGSELEAGSEDVTDEVDSILAFGEEADEIQSDSHSGGEAEKG